MNFHLICFLIVGTLIVKIKSSNFKILNIRHNKTNADTIKNDHSISDIEVIEDTKGFFTRNGYDLINIGIQNSMLQKFESLKKFSENPAIREGIKLTIFH